MKTNLLLTSRVLLLFLMLAASSGVCLRAQLAYQIDTCRISCNDYDRLTNYVTSVSALVEVSVDLVTLVRDQEEKTFLIHFRVHDMLYGSFPDTTFRILFSKPILVEAVIQGYIATHGPSFCGNTFDGVRGMFVSDPKTGYWGLMGLRKTEESYEMVFPGPDFKYDFGKEPEMTNGKVNYEGVKKVDSLNRDFRTGRKHTLFANRGELLEFLSKLP